MKGKPIWGKEIGVEYHKTKRNVKYLDSEMKIMSSSAYVLVWVGERMGEGTWAKSGICSKCSLLDFHNIKELFSLEGL